MVAKRRDNTGGKLWINPQASPHLNSRRAGDEELAGIFDAADTPDTDDRD